VAPALVPGWDRRSKNQEAAVQSKFKDTGRMWLWGFLAVIALAQLYVVRELLAAFVIFTLGFAALALVVASLYALQKSAEFAVARVATLRHPVMDMARATRKMASVSNISAVGHEERKAA
jgi:hypothetical protein